MKKANQHRFRRYCIDGRQLVEGKTLRTFVKSLARQSKSKRSQEIYGDRVREKYALENDYAKRGFRSPIYFGEGGEFLRHCYFEFFCHKYNLEEVWSLNSDHGPISEDLGWDGGAVSATNRTHADSVVVRSGSPIYIQDKVTEHHERLHSLNDGSRLMNFFGSASLHAIATGRGDDSRFIVWTTGKGIDKALYKRTHGRVEIVGSEAISEDIDGNSVFWKYVSSKFTAL